MNYAQINSYYKSMEVSEDQAWYTPVTDFAKHGITASIASGAFGISNTGVAFANMLGADLEETDFVQKLDQIGMTATARYAEENRTLVDFGGLVAGSIVPGVLGIKALHLAQKGLAASSTRSVTGLRALMVPKNQLEAMLDGMEKTGTVASTNMELARKAAKQGFHQQFLEAAFAETSILLTMNQHTMINDGDLDYLGSFTNNLGSLALGTVIGGGVGGVAATVALKNQMQGAIRTIFNEQRTGISLGLSKSNLDIAPGHYIANAINDLDSVRTQLNANPTNLTVANELRKTEEHIKLEIGKAIRETSKGSVLAGSADYGGHISLALTEAALEIDAARGIHNFAGMTKIKGVAEQYSIFEPRAEIAMFHQNKDSLAAAAKEFFPYSTADEIDAWATKQWNTTNGFAFPGATSEKGAHVLNHADRTAEQKMFTLRHEVGHLTGWKLARRLEADELGRGIREQMVKASRMARPDNWASVDRYKIEVDEMREMLADMDVDSPAYRQASLRIRDREEWIADMNNPDELLADSLAMFTSYRYEQVSKELKSLDSLFRGNNVLRARMRETDVIMDLQTKNIYKQLDRQPTIADMGKFKMQGNKMFVDYARETRVYQDLDKPLDILNDTAQQASAKYLWAKQNLLTEDTPSIVLAPDDFVGHFRVMESVKAGWKGKVEVNDFDPRTTLTTLREEFDLSQDTEIMARLFRHFVAEQKVKTSHKLRKLNTEKGATKPQVLSETDIARLLDTDVKWQQYYSMQSMIDKNNESIGLAFWSDKYDPTKPTQVRMTYEREIGAPQNDNEVRSMVHVKKAIDSVRETAQNQIQSYYAVAFKDAKFTLPPTTVQAGSNRYRGTVATDDTQGVVTTQQGQYGGDVEHANASGRALGILHAYSDKRISELVEPAAHAVVRDPQAVAEAAVSISKFRQYKMEEIPPEWKLKGLEASGGPVRNWFNRIAQSNVGTDTAAIELAAEKSARLEGVLKTLTDHVNAPGSMHAVSYDILKKLEDVAMADKLNRGDIADLIEMVKHQTATVQIPSVANLWKAMREANQHTVKGAQLSASLRGKSASWNANQFYPGTLDRELYKDIAFVKPSKPGLFGDREFMIVGGPNGTVTQDKINLLRTKYGSDVEVITPASNTERHKQLLQDYEDGLNIDSFYMDHSKLNLGKAADIMPDPNPQLVWSMLESYKRQARGVLTNIQKQYYDEEWQTLESLEKIRLNNSGDLGSKNKEASVFQDRMATMLNMPNDNRFKSWREAQRTADQVFSSVWNTLVTAPLRATGAKWAGAVEGNYAEMNKLADKYGLPQPYTPEMKEYLVGSLKVNNQILSSAIPQMNWLGATLTLRLDFVQPIINAISLPILAQPEIKHLIDALPDLRKQAITNSLRSSAVDKTGKELASEISNTKLMYQATVNWHKNRDLMNYYTELGIVGERAQLYMNAVDSAATVGQKLVDDHHGVAGAVSEAMGKGIGFLTKFGDATDDYVRFVAADMARQVLEAGGVKGKVADMAIQSYVNRVTGNYHYAQRPAMFQGFAGQAIGLFQTYQFNLIQQLMRHLGDKPSRAAAMMGLQTGIFGAQSTPGFELLNNHVAERSNYEGDFYTGINNALGDMGRFGSAADWVLYGVASNFTRPIVGDGVDFFSRGNLNPRSAIIIPSSLEDVPLVSMTTKFLSSMGQAANNLAGGVPVWDTFTQALATNGVNRPLQGIGQLLAGERITSQGSTLLSTADLDWFQAGARMMGSRGMDEAIAVANYYRAVKYESARQDKLQSLGSVVKAHVNAGSWDGEAYGNFMQQYTETGGDVEKYDKWTQGLYKSATESQIQGMYQKHDSVEGRYMQQLMGAGVEQYINPWNVQ